MKALYKSAPGDSHLDLVERPVPELNEVDNVLVKVTACSVCGMDHRIYHGGYPSNPPFTMGHELVGIVERTLDGVTEVKAGDRVTLKPHLYACGECDACKMGLIMFCKDKKTVGIDRDGAMTTYVAVPAAHLCPVPAEVPDSLACLSEPFSMIYGNMAQSVREWNAKTVVIIGAGQVGMFALVAAKSLGVENVIVSGITNDANYRFPIAKKLGADYIVDSLQESLVDKVMEVTNGLGADIVLDASGSEAGINQAIKAVKKGGLVAAMGMTRKESIAVCWDVCIKKAVRIQFFFQSNYKYMEEALSHLAHPYTDLSPLISMEGKLSQWKELFDYMDSHDTLKNILYIDC